MQYNFDVLVDKSNCGSVKYLTAEEKNVPEDVLAMFGAEFEFPTCPYVADAMVRKAQSASYAYSTAYTDEYFNAVCWWMKNVHRFEVCKDWIVPTDGVLRSFCSCIKAFTEIGDAVLIQTPVFGAYRKHIEKLGRRTVEISLNYDRGVYSFDFETLEQKLKTENVRLIVLCNPVNPTGMIISPADQDKIIELAIKYGALIFVDEIFGDLPDKNGNTTRSLADGKGKNIVISSSSIGKTFSFGGAKHANTIIPNEKLREKFIQQRDMDYYDGIDPFMYIAIIAAYTPKGSEWLKQMQTYVNGTAEMVRKFFSVHFPEIIVCRRDTGYLLWIDWSAWMMDSKKLNAYLEKAGMYMDGGAQYGKGCDSFTRMVIACPRKYVKESLDRLLMLTQKEPPAEGNK